MRTFLLWIGGICLGVGFSHIHDVLGVFAFVIGFLTHVAVLIAETSRLTDTRGEVPL